ncbi:hypothetical protein LZZ90_04605 [Flavobacterium sp. SM15]|uniref:hypothetical protein n=1 Tax=Flavobacterium sp. SM15 TaxID=2908005 RepID=UPI001EDB219C|nr:hypothetical protein [Flavobacterium sp. SM15]MCG2610779.1 hypothetical protein [Flavobacterium sp. SM15]
MAQYTTKEFSILTGESEATIRKHIERGKLVRNVKGFIDEENPINLVYIRSVAHGLGITPRYFRNSNNEIVLININLYPPEEVVHLR